MGIQLRLDADALAALFPEGSQARVELQSAVIEEFLRKHFKPSTFGADVAAELQRIEKHFDAAKKLAVDEELRKLGISKDHYLSGVTLSPEVREQIRRETQTAANAQLNASVEAVTSNLSTKVAQDAEAAVKRILDAQIQEQVRTRVLNVVSRLQAGAT